ncbi:MAG: hypothetical protein L0J01_06260 [Tetragenococcus halophilus]|nr:hypothetical protein [Tetragenococcus halophilus]MDN6184992.1 hypothetical protein [Lactococcus lactis]MDN6294638.1 hypothetical protein [Alkalibacterium sp.]MDN6317839.1 hypothetical protein [Lactococcus lactis]
MNKKGLKKLQIILISLSVLVLLAACGNGDTEEPAVDDEPAVEEPVDEETDNEELDKQEEDDNPSDSDDNKENDALADYSTEEIEYARVWLQMKDNMDINELKVIYIKKGDPVNPYEEEESAEYPEDVIMLSGAGVAGNPGVVYSGNGDGTINLYDIPSHWQEGIEPEGQTMEEYTRDIIENTEEIYIEPRDEEDVEKLIQKIKIED